jgi:hypothetical protein
MILSSDHSASIRCPKHGRNGVATFARPEPHEGAAAGYVCFHCWWEAGHPATMPKEQVYERLGVPR